MGRQAAATSSVSRSSQGDAANRASFSRVETLLCPLPATEPRARVCREGSNSVQVRKLVPHDAKIGRPPERQAVGALPPAPAEPSLEARIALERLQALEHMAQGVTHDLNNALSLVLGYAELLLETNGLASDQRQKLERIAEGAISATGILKRLALFHRQSTPEATDYVPLAGVVCDSARQLAKRLENGGMTNADRSRIELAVDDSLYVLGNPEELRCLVAELVTNALEASPANRRVRVTLQRQAQTAVLQVIDRGSGMPAEFGTRCLEPFQTTKCARGAGLGLSICQGIVRRHGGSLQIETGLGNGTTVTVRIPVADLPVVSVRGHLRA